MRVFLAIPLPGPVLDGLADRVGSFRPEYPGWRWVRPGGIHLTLRFLGEIAPERLRAAEGHWRESAARSPVPRFTIVGVGVFPSTKAPRVLWAGIGQETPEGSLGSLAASLETGATVAGAAREGRPFRAHLTLARATRGSRPAIPPADALGTGWEVQATEVVLFRSELLPRGARYTPLSRFPIGVSGA